MSSSRVLALLNRQLEYQTFNSTALFSESTSQRYSRTEASSHGRAKQDMVGRNVGDIWSRNGMEFHEKKEILKLQEELRVVEGAVNESEKVRGLESWCETVVFRENNSKVQKLLVTLNVQSILRVPHVDSKDYKLELALNNGNVVKASALDKLTSYLKH